MGSPYLGTDESIILSAHDLVINTVPAEAILTNQRLMLVDKSHPRLLPQDIPFTAIETVTIGENSGNDPILSLSIATPDGTRQPLGMTFPQSVRTNRTTDRDEWATRIRELSVTAQHEGGIVAFELLPPWVPGPVPEDMAVDSDTEVVPAGTKFKGTTLSERRSRAAGSSKTRMIGIAAAILVVIAIIIAAIFFYAPPFTSQQGTPATPVPTPVITVIPTPAPTLTMPPVQTPAVVATPVLTPSAPATVTTIPVAQGSSTIPQKGVWVRVQYDGKFSGSVGAPGRFRDVAGSTEGVYQIPAKDEFVTATIQKGDNSGNPLTVEIYNDGTLLKSETIIRPKGTITMNVDLKGTSTSSAVVHVTASAAASP
jgi:hypothetical protein